MKRMIISLLAALVITSGCASGDTAGNNFEEEAEAAQTGEKAGVATNPQEEKQSGESSEEQDAEDETSDGEDRDIQQEERDADPAYELKAANWTLEPINDANGKVTLITIDDAPDKYGVEMAKTLKKLEAPAIFFVNGHFIDTDEEKERLKQIHEMGFPIGNHTYSHGRLDKLSVEKQTEEIVKLNNEIEAVTGERPKFFRAPFGINTDHSKKVVEEEGMLLMNWTYGYDWDKNYTTKEALSDIMINSPYLTDGANLLMHDREWTNAALEDIVAGLRGKGYEMLDPALIKVPE
ncbi:polysaccharide deacetylase family protein [Bacillus marinisedimentorum]|uniref:polysaccharide deacetylase family protein n=1 Tax=Bacillus marinisedimentorum TaxID=1821260 RepID=UPI0009F4ACF8